MNLNRSVSHYSWLLAAAFLAVDVFTIVLDRTIPGRPEVSILIYLLLLAAGLTFESVRLPSGYLAMSGIATSAAALTLSPRLAVAVGMVGGILGSIAVSKASTNIRVLTAFGAGSWTAAAAWLHTALVGEVPDGFLLPLTTAAWTLANWTVTGSIGALVYGRAPWIVISRNLNRHWFGAFLYFALTAIIMATQLDGSVKGFVVATLVALLSLALADSVAGRELRVRLQQQIDDADRYLLHSRVVEGTVHDVRNFLAIGLAHLHEAAEDQSKHVTAAEEAVQDAVEALNRLQMGSNPKIRWAEEPIDLGQLAGAVVALADSKAAERRIRCVAENTQPSAAVRGDPLLLRQVVTNLVLNAIEAVATGGHVTVRTGNRGDRAMLQVIDDGPGIPDKYRDRLFEPHFTTKPSGSGIGLFVSYGIVREHRGELLYEGNKNGAVFTVLLPAA